MRLRNGLRLSSNKLVSEQHSIRGNTPTGIPWFTASGLSEQRTRLCNLQYIRLYCHAPLADWESSPLITSPVGVGRFVRLLRTSRRKYQYVVVYISQRKKNILLTNTAMAVHMRANIESALGL